MDRLQVFKALGDNTRYAIYLELARSATPLSTADIAELLQLHPNTVRPHLDRMRDVGLIESTVEGTGVVGRPQHRFSLAADAPSLGLEGPSYRLLAQLLAGVASIGASAEDVAAIGQVQGEEDARRQSGAGCVAALTEELATLGFDPVTTDQGSHASIGFGHCPFRELAEAFPELVCGLHKGIVEGFVNARGDGEVTVFGRLIDRDPCRVELRVG